MLTTLAGLPASAADSARAAASVYTASLLATAPIVAAAIGSVCNATRGRRRTRARLARRRRDAARGARGSFASAAARRMVGAFDRRRAARRARAHPGRRSRFRMSQAPATTYQRDRVGFRSLFAMYVAGVLVALSPTVVASIRARRTVRRASRARRRSLVDDRSRGSAVAPRCTPRGSAVRKPRRERPDDVGPTARGDSSAHCGERLDRGTSGGWCCGTNSRMCAGPIGPSASRRASRAPSSGSIPGCG